MSLFRAPPDAPSSPPKAGTPRALSLAGREDATGVGERRPRSRELDGGVLDGSELHGGVLDGASAVSRGSAAAR